MTERNQTRVELEATKLKSGRFAVRPKDQLGTHGWHPIPWEVIYVSASSREEAVQKAYLEMRRAN